MSDVPLLTYTPTPWKIRGRFRVIVRSPSGDPTIISAAITNSEAQLAQRTLAKGGMPAEIEADTRSLRRLARSADERGIQKILVFPGMCGCGCGMPAALVVAADGSPIGKPKGSDCPAAPASAPATTPASEPPATIKFPLPEPAPASSPPAAISPETPKPPYDSPRPVRRPRPWPLRMVRALLFWLLYSSPFA